MLTRKFLLSLGVIGILGVASRSQASAESFVRWTYAESSSADMGDILAKLSDKTGFKLDLSQFSLDEDRPLAYNHYRRYSEEKAGVRVQGMSIRVWSVTTKFGESLVQVEAALEDPAQPAKPGQLNFLMQLKRKMQIATGRDAGEADVLAQSFSHESAAALVREYLKSEDDHGVVSMTHRDWWRHGELIREVIAHTKHGKHIFVISHLTKAVLEHRYEGHPNSDLAVSETYSLPAQIYPIYEEFGGQKLDRIPVTLTHLLNQAPRPTSDPFTALRTQHYLDSKQDLILAQTPEGRAQGYWSDPMIRDEVAKVIGTLTPADNFVSGPQGALLVGERATVSIHPDALDKFPGVNITHVMAPYVFEMWTPVAGSDEYEMIPRTAFFGKPLLSEDDALNRPATRDPQHNPAVYINDGFDEVQVYYAINRLFEALQPKGFIDPELATRPFHAFLYDPDIENKDNAYYSNDTINFSTYSPTELNYARDNTTIWHELGHGVMDRLMGDYISLNDTGGLSEGMADFVAQMVMADALPSQVFPGSNDQRIINKTGFYLTNESHDDGEAYGGTMKDILDASIAAWGKDGIVKMTDLTLETMRLTRDHPHLTAQDWYDHMIFADSIGRPNVRAPGELASIITSSFSKRNFIADSTQRASLSIAYNEVAVEAGAAGSRAKPIPTGIWGEGTTKTFTVKVKYHASEQFAPQPPFKIKVALRGGPLQGAIHWVGEENSPLEFLVTENDKEVEVPLTVTGVCDSINRDDGGCSDFAYIQIWSADPDATKPVAKKRFYLRLSPPSK